MRISFSILAVSYLSLCVVSTSNAGGVQIGRTRIIYDADKKEVALPLVNKEKEAPWLIQSWTDTGDGTTRGPFIVTPPLFRLDPLKEQSLRIAWSGVPVPQDIESLFYMNVRTIPATAKDSDDKNTLKLIFKTRMKLFFRPKDLPGSLVESCKNLSFSRSGNTLHVTNPGAYYSVFDTLKLGSASVEKADFVSPKGNAEIPLPAHSSGKKVTWRCITEYGNATEIFTVDLT
ncbi:fimbrial biogenesis chaperone [Buttiauxella brennerae]|uniref:fimbrial biogenesis chaperone n=1 Tax=Buttiauxella brennerae TaxID=82988 RepID=UPI00286EEA65|nr:molecular chaperone [Buttiauxella brennerae]